MSVTVTEQVTFCWRFGAVCRNGARTDSCYTTLPSLPGSGLMLWHYLFLLQFLSLQRGVWDWMVSGPHRRAVLCWPFQYSVFWTVDHCTPPLPIKRGAQPVAKDWGDQTIEMKNSAKVRLVQHSQKIYTSYTSQNPLGIEVWVPPLRDKDFPAEKIKLGTTSLQCRTNNSARKTVGLHNLSHCYGF